METNKVQRFYQKKQFLISTQNVEVTIDFDTDIQWERVVGIIVYSNTDYTANVNLQFSKPLKINNREIFPEDFDTFFLQARDEFNRFTQIYETAKGSKVSGSIVDPAVVATPYYVTIQLELERDIKN